MYYRDVQTTTETVTEPRKPIESDEFGKGVVLYLKNDKVVGVLLWNVFKSVPIARQVFYFYFKITFFVENPK